MNLNVLLPTHYTRRKETWCPKIQILVITISNGRLFKSQGFHVNEIEESAFLITRKMV